jgi:hypothetical protein
VAPAYRVVAALGFALAPGALYLLTKALTASRLAATVAAVAYVFAPSASYFMNHIRANGESFFEAGIPGPWRLVALVEYGEGPHVLGVALALFGAAAALRYVRQPTPGGLVVACALAWLVAMTNLIALLGYALLVVGLLAESADPWLATRRVARIAIFSVALTLLWYSPSFVGAVMEFSAPGDARGGPSFLLLAPLAVAAVALGRRVRGSVRLDGVGAVVCWVSMLLPILIARETIGLALAPQPIRYALELDAAVAIGLGIAVVYAARRALRSGAMWRAVPVASALILAVLGSGAWANVQDRLESDPNWRDWSQRTTALWLREHLGPGERAYLTGDHAFWANAFADVPQVRGGSDFSYSDPWWAHASYQINTGKDRDISVMWLKALAVRYVVVADRDAGETFLDYHDPAKFEGALQVAHSTRGLKVYEVEPLTTAPFALAASHLAELPAPRDGIDRDALAAYLDALRAPAPGRILSATPRGHARWDLVVETSAAATLVMRQANDSGWRATVDGTSAALHSDPVGFAALDLPTAGPHQIVLEHRPHRDLTASGAFGSLLIAFVLGRAAYRERTSLFPLARESVTAAPHALVAAFTTILGAVLGAWTGFPKGSDAPSHLTRLRFVADHFPNHNWLYAWGAGMPTFESYPPLPYLGSFVATRLFGAEPTLFALGYAAMLSFALGLQAFLALSTGSRLAAFLATICASGSLAVWTWLVNDGLYARLVACGVGVWALYACERWHRSRSRPSWIATAVLLAATVASHAFMGIVFSGIVSLHTLTRWRTRGIRPLAQLAGLSLLLAAPAWIPVVFAGSGVAGRFFGAAHGAHVLLPVEVLWRVDHVGPAVPFLAVLAVVASVALRHRPPLLFVGLTTLAILYTFAPSLGIPNELYYVNGIDPFTATFFVAVFASCAAAYALAPAAARLRREVVAGTGAIVVAVALLGALTGAEALASNGTYPQIFDTSSPERQSAISQRTLRLPDDLDHRIMPNTAEESVWLSYRYRMPQLRDYYGQGQVHPDWLALAYTTMYDPPYQAEIAAALLDWYAVSIVTVDSGSSFAANLAAMERSGDFTVTRGAERFVRLDLREPTALVAESILPLTVVVGSDDFYKMVVRTLLREGAGPSRAVPIHWRGDLADLDAGLRERTGALVIGAGRDGDERRAAEVAMAVARQGASVLVDLTGRDARGELAAILPVAGVERVAFAADWGMRGDGSVDPLRFASARYEGAVWSAEVGTALRDGARAVLSVADRPVVATRSEGAGTITALGGNLIFHADYTRSESERAFLMRYLATGAERTTRDITGTFLDPQHRRVRTEAPSLILFKESWTPAWSATFEDGGGRRSTPVLLAGPGLMAAVAPGPGTLEFGYTSRPTDWAAWLLALAGLGVVLRPRLRRLVRR